MKFSFPNHRPASMAALGLGLLVGFADVAHAQLRVIEGKSLKFPDYYEAPHQNQLKSLLEGSRVQPQPGDIYLVTDARLQTFREDGAPEMIITAPQCVYDRGSHIISSAGSMHAQTADGGFSIEGEGFSCQPTNSSLVISNKAHTKLDPDLLQSKDQKTPPKDTPQSLGQIDVVSDHFDYSGTSGLGVYSDSVHVAGTNMTMTSGILTVVLPMKERQKPSEVKTIIAEKDVVMDYLLANQETVHATGDRVTYSTDTSLARVTGHPTWRAEQREGRGDELIIDRADRTFLANGQAWFKMPSRTNGMGGILPEPAMATTNASVVATNQFVEVFSDNYEFRTNMALFREDVHVTERAGEQIKGKMTCRLLTLTFSGTNELQRMVADEKVVIEQGDQGFSAGKAVYEGRTGLLELTDEPSWRSGLREGKGDLVQVDVKHNEMNVKGNAFMRVPAQEMGETGKAGSKEPKEAKPADVSNQFADLFSEEYVLSAKEARFSGKVRIDHPRMKWTCEKMTAFLPPAGEKNQKIVAEQGVVFDLSESESQPDRKVHGTGEKVVYTYGVTSGATNDVVEMTGNPVLQTAQGTFENKVIILDRAHNTLNAPGKYRIHGTAVANVADFTPSFKKSR